MSTKPVFVFPVAVVRLGVVASLIVVAPESVFAPVLVKNVADEPTNVIEPAPVAVNPLAITGVVNVGEASVPTLVNDDPVTPAAKLAPVSVPAAAVIVIGALPSKFVPFMARAVCSVVAVSALPVVLPEDPEQLPVTLPVNAAVIVPAAKLPDTSRATTVLAVFALATPVPVGNPVKIGVTSVGEFPNAVSDEFTIDAASVVPVNVLASGGGAP